MPYIVYLLILFMNKFMKENVHLLCISFTHRLSQTLTNMQNIKLIDLHFQFVI